MQYRLVLLGFLGIILPSGAFGSLEASDAITAIPLDSTFVVLSDITVKPGVTHLQFEEGKLVGQYRTRVEMVKKAATTFCYMSFAPSNKLRVLHADADGKRPLISAKTSTETISESRTETHTSYIVKRGPGRYKPQFSFFDEDRNQYDKIPVTSSSSTTTVYGVLSRVELKSSTVPEIGCFIAVGTAPTPPGPNTSVEAKVADLVKHFDGYLELSYSDPEEILP